ncbi:MAG: DUF6531 domain-containing protein [Acidimicrobiales bacterium]
MALISRARMPHRGILSLLRPAVTSALAATALLAGLVSLAPNAGPPRNSPEARIAHPRYALASSSTNWGVQLQPPYFSGVSCPSMNDCFAVGNRNDTKASNPFALVVYSTTDRGASWAIDQSAPASFESNTIYPTGAISCVGSDLASTTCVVLAYTGIEPPSPLAVVTDNGGQTWSVYPISAASPLDSVSCLDVSSTIDCWAVGGPDSPNSSSPVIMASTDGGETWASEAVPTAVTYLNAVDCLDVSSTIDCWAVGGGYYNGSSRTSGAVVNITNALSSTPTWSQQSGHLPAGLGGLSGISCVSTSSGIDCWAVGSGLTSFDTDTTRDSDNDSDGDDDDGDATKVSAAIVAMATNVGSTWTSQVSVGLANFTGLVSVDCVSSSRCFATGNGDTPYMAYTNDGTSWSEQKLPPVDQGSITNGTNGLDGAGNGSGSSMISCADTSACELVRAQSIDGTQNAGSAWVAQTLSPSFGGMHRYKVLSCPTSLKCIAVSRSDNVWATFDGGAVWTPVGTIPTIQGPSDAATYADSMFLPTAFACANALDCWVGGYYLYGTGTPTLYYTLDGGTHWSTDTFPANTNSFPTSLSCTSTSVCWALSTNGRVFEGTPSPGSPESWTVKSNFPTSDFKISDTMYISCPSGSECLVTGGNSTTGVGVIVVTTDSGSSWTSESLPSSVVDVTEASCASSSSCWAIGTLSGSPSSPTILYSSNVNSTSGPSWTAESVPSGVDSLNSISCPSVSECFAIGQITNGAGGTSSTGIISTTDAGTTWTEDVMPPSVGTGYWPEVSCANALDCWAMMQPGTVLSTNGISAGPNGGAFNVWESYGGYNPSEPCFSCLARRVGLSMQSLVGDPVNTATGALVESYKAFSLPGAGVPLSFSLSYDSSLAQAQLSSSQSPGPLGYGWSDNLGMHLIPNSPSSGDVTVVQQNGSEARFSSPSTNASGTTTWSPVVPRITSTLSESNATYTFSLQGGQRIYLFNSQGQLTSETDPSGYKTTFAYAMTSSTSPTCPATAASCSVVTQQPDVLDPTVTRSLTLAYNSSGQLIEAILTAGSSTRTWSLGYDSFGNLTSITDPMNRVTNFAYDTTNPQSYLQHDMIARENPAGDATSYTYDGYGRVTSIKNAKGAVTEAFSYEADALSATGGATITTNALGAKTLYTYAYGEKLSVTKAYGTSSSATWNYIYDPAIALPSKVIDPMGATTTFTYDASGNVTSSENPVGATTEATYNSLNQPLTTTNAAGTTTVYTYDSYHRLISKMTDPDWSNDQKSDTPESSSDTDTDSSSSNPEPTWSYVYSTAHPSLVDSSKGPRGNTTSYTHDPYGNLTTTVNASGAKTTYYYDALGNLLSLTDARGHTTSYVYNADAELTMKMMPQTASDPTGLGILYAYDALGNLVSKMTDPDWSNDQKSDTPESSSDTDADSSSSNPENRTTYAYADPGNPTKMTSKTNPQGKTTNYSYNAAGEVLTTTNPRGGLESYSYDPMGQLTSTSVDPDSATDSPGVSEAAETPGTDSATTQSIEGATTAYAYDPAGRLISKITDTDADASQESEEAPSATTAENFSQNPESSTSYTYNAAGERTSTTTGENTKIESQSGSAASFASRTVYAYDLLGNVVSVSTDPDFATDNNTPDGANDVDADSNQATNPENTTTYAYADPAYPHKVTSVVDPLGNTTTYFYDLAGDKVTRTDPLGVTTTYVYNDLRQLESVSYSDSTPSVSYTYNAIGEKKTVADASGTTTYYYDNAGQLTSKVLDADATTDATSESKETTTSDSTETAFQEQPISYSYDPIGELTHISYAGGTEVSYTYLDGLMVSVNDGLGDTTSFAYGANSHLDEITYPQSTSTSTSYGYNPAGVMTTTSVLSPAGDSSLTDMYNSSQMLYAMDWNTGQSFSYAYDASERMSQPGNYSYTYDSSGRTTSQVITNGPSFSYTNNAGSELTQESCAVCTPSTQYFSYNARGETTSMSSTSPAGTCGSTGNYCAGWNAAGEFTSVQNPQQAPSSFSYNADHLVSSITPEGSSTTQSLVWSSVGTQTPELIYQGTSSAWTSYIFGPNHLVIEQLNCTSSSGATSCTPEYLIDGRMGSEHAAINSSGALIGSYGYSPYGSEYNLAGSTAPSFGFDGYAYLGVSSQTDFYYLINRWYNPETGTFLSVDPAVATTGQPYAYAGDNPANASDPSGLWCILGHNPNGGCRGSSALNWFNKNVNPAYMALNGYSNEIQATESGCSWWTSFQYGLQGAAGVGLAAGMAVGAEEGGAALLRIFSGSAAGEEGGALADASSAAFDAADNAGDWTVSAKHLAGSGGNWAKFAAGTDPNALAAQALRSTDALFLPNSGGAADSFIVKNDLGQVIGTQGQTWLKVIVSNDGQIITAYPVKG